jgi:hypothetical protein
MPSQYKEVFSDLIANLWPGCMHETPPSCYKIAAAVLNPSSSFGEPTHVTGIYSDGVFRLMSDYEVTLVNDNSRPTPCHDVPQSTDFES